MESLDERELQQLRARFEKTLAGNQHPRLLTPLPRRARFRLAAGRVRNGIGIWLCERGQWRLAKRWWRL